MPDRVHGERVVAYVTLRGGPSIHEQEPESTQGNVSPSSRSGENRLRAELTEGHYGKDTKAAVEGIVTHCGGTMIQEDLVGKFF